MYTVRTCVLRMGVATDKSCSESHHLRSLPARTCSWQVHRTHTHAVLLNALLCHSGTRVHTRFVRAAPRHPHTGGPRAVLMVPPHPASLAWTHHNMSQLYYAATTAATTSYCYCCCCCYYCSCCCCFVYHYL